MVRADVMKGKEEKKMKKMVRTNPDDAYDAQEGFDPEEDYDEEAELRDMFPDGMDDGFSWDND